MKKKKLIEKWQQKVKVHLSGQNNATPEEVTRKYLKANAAELFIDLKSVNEKSKKPITPKSFVIDLVDFAVDSCSKSGSGAGTFSASPHWKPDLDFYDRMPSQPTPNYYGN